jgi:hypothetical protein
MMTDLEALIDTQWCLNIDCHINNKMSHRLRIAMLGNLLIVDGRLGVVVGILTYYARGRGFDSRTVQTFERINMSVCIRSGCFYV